MTFNKAQQSQPTAGTAIVKLKIAILALLFCGTATAKCFDYPYKVIGSTLDPSGKPVSGVLVTASWKAWPVQGLAQATSNKNGQFNLELILDKLSGEGARGDECDGKLDTISITGTKEGYIESTQEISATNCTIKASIRLHKKHG